MEEALSQKSKMQDEPFQEIKALGWPDPVLILTRPEPEGCLTRLDRHFDFLKWFVRHFRFLRQSYQYPYPDFFYST